VAAEPERYEFRYEDETHVETNPYLARVWHRRGKQPTVPAAGTNRRLTVFGSVETLGRGRGEVVCAGQDSACFGLYLAALDARHEATGKEVFLALDNGPCHTSEASRAALAARVDWLHVIWLAKYSPELNRKEREWRVLKRDARGHLAPSLPTFVDGILEGLRQLGGERMDIHDHVPDWWLAGHRKEPTGRPPGRPKGAKDSYKRAPYRKKLPAAA
jgi:DDE superfamily endonuclease